MRQGFSAILLGALLVGCSGGGGSSGSPSTSSTDTVPGAPTIGTATAGNASATLSFSAPASDGGAAITGYTATCTAGSASQTATGSSSPITVSSLTNGTAYSCSVTASNSVGTSVASASVSVTPTAGAAGTDTVPGAPTIGTATAGNASATLSFSAPASDGGAAITGYTATCTAGSASQTATGSSSPITVSSLTNGTTYGCSVTATNSVGTSVASASVSVTPTAGATGTGTASTASVYCTYSETTYEATDNLTSDASWTCSSTSRMLTANGLPDHPVGTFPNSNNPNTISAQSVSFSATLTPTVASSDTAGGETTLSYALNGVKFDPATAGTCPTGATATSNCSLIGNSGSWSIEAIGQSVFDFGVDSNNAHVQPNGAYHYHGMPTGILNNNGVSSSNVKMLLVGFAPDGFPIYARYGHTTATDGTSALKVITSSYSLKTTPDSGRPPTSVFPMGTFTQDYEYVAGSGDLDECNGRFDVTPEFPNGIYHYYVTDTWPYLTRFWCGTVS